MIDVYGADWCADCRRSKNLLTRLRVPFNYLDVENDDAARVRAIEISGRQAIPVVVLPDGSSLVEPSDPLLRSTVTSLGLVPPD